MSGNSTTRLPSGRTGPKAILFSFLLACFSLVMADSEVSDTAVTGSDDPDVITIDESTDAAAALLSDIGETATATASVIDAMGGGDTIAVSADISALGISELAIIAEPGKASAVAGANGILAGSGDDEVVATGGIGASANALGAYAGPVTVDDEDSGDDNEIELSVSTEATATGIDGGEGDDAIATSGPVESSALAVAGGSADQLDVTLTKSVTVKSEASSSASATGIQSGAGNDAVTATGPVDVTADAISGALSVGVVANDPDDATRKVSLDMSATAKSDAKATGIETEDEATEEESKLTTPFGTDGLPIVRRTPMMNPRCRAFDARAAENGPKHRSSRPRTCCCAWSAERCATTRNAWTRSPPRGTRSATWAADRSPLRKNSPAPALFSPFRPFPWCWSPAPCPPCSFTGRCCPSWSAAFPGGCARPWGSVERKGWRTR